MTKPRWQIIVDPVDIRPNYGYFGLILPIFGSSWLFPVDPIN